MFQNFAYGPLVHVDYKSPPKERNSETATSPDLSIVLWQGPISFFWKRLVVQTLTLGLAVHV